MQSLLSAMATFVTERLDHHHRQCQRGSNSNDSPQALSTTQTARSQQPQFTVTSDTIEQLLAGMSGDRPPGLASPVVPAAVQAAAEAASSSTAPPVQHLDGAPVVLRRPVPVTCQNCEGKPPQFLCNDCPDDEAFLCS